MEQLREEIIESRNDSKNLSKQMSGFAREFAKVNINIEYIKEKVSKLEKNMTAIESRGK